MKVSNIMTRQLYCVTPEEPISRAAQVMAHADVGMLPVVESSQSMHLVGVITDRDIAVRHVSRRHTTECPVRSHMTTGNLATAHKDDDIHTVMRLIGERQVRRIPVVDGEERVIGVVSQADLALHVAPAEPRAFEQMLEAVSSPALASV